MVVNLQFGTMLKVELTLIARSYIGSLTILYTMNIGYRWNAWECLARTLDVLV